MKNWIVLQTADATSKMLENPYVSAAGGVLLYLFTMVYGHDIGIRTGMTIFIILLVMDFLSGTSAAKKDHIDTSKDSIDGIKKMVFILLIPALAQQLDIQMNTNNYITGFTIAALARPTTKSLLANLKRTGWDRLFDSMPGLLKWIEAEIDHKDARAAKRLEEIKKKASGE